ncbi:FAD/NAD(P)-binding domain-containing protein [Mycena kentingensis (nom. inval.)]|nr:FAD/NAD(P)-binding domain-containing protein [Mycena kentingensis (nom. inval.)]
MTESVPFSEVCIVGAGPSGLACALGLAARNVPFTIIDALPEGHNDSRSVLMHASALETLELTHPKLCEALVTAGVTSKSVPQVNKKGDVVFEVRISELAPHTKYPFCLLLSQHKVEACMREHLPQSVQWGTRLAAIAEAETANGAGLGYELTFTSGEKLRARYVVGADGGKSLVRGFAGIRYSDPHTGEEAVPSPRDLSYVVSDVEFAEPLPSSIARDTLQLVAGEGILTAPLLPSEAAFYGSHPVKNCFRLYVGIPDGNPPSAPDAAYLQPILQARGPGSEVGVAMVPQIVRVLHSARFRTRVALVDRYWHRSRAGTGYILLAGDAAHKHGPAGGQGLNLGVCDGCELAEAIATHRAQPAEAETDEVFEAYSTRRRDIAQQVIAMVDRMTESELGAGDGWGPYIRQRLVRLAAKVPAVNAMLAWQVSGMAYRKRNQ